MQNSYTIKEFSKKQGLSEEYVRQACCCRPDSKGAIPKLDEKYQPVKLGSSWLIREIIPFESLVQQSIQEHNPQIIKSQYLLVDLATTEIDVVCLHSKYFTYGYCILFDVFSLSGYHQDSLGDQLLYSIYRELSNKTQGTKLYKKYLHLIANWLLQSGINFFFNHDLSPFPCEYCLHCGIKVITTTKRPTPPVYFCNQAHRNRFYKDTNQEGYIIAKIKIFKDTIKQLANLRMNAKQNGHHQQSQNYSQQMKNQFVELAKYLIDRLPPLEAPAQLQTTSTITDDQMIYAFYHIAFKKIDWETFALEHVHENTSELTIKQLIASLLLDQIRQSRTISKITKNILEDIITPISPIINTLYLKALELSGEYKLTQKAINEIKNESAWLRLYR